MLRVFFGRHKCASKWTALLIERMCNELGWKSVIAYRNRIEEHGSLRALVENERPDFLIIPESDATQVEEIPVPFKGFHISRAPRDIVVSGYFSHLKVHALVTDPSKGVTAEHRKRLQEMTKKAGIDLELATIARIPLQHLHQWNYDDPRILETTFTRMTTSSFGEWTSILAFLNMIKPQTRWTFGSRCFVNRLLKRFGMGGLRMRTESYAPAQLGKTLRDLSFENLKRGKPWWLNQRGAHYRKGKAGNWKEHLAPEQEAEIERLFPGLIARHSEVPHSDQ